MARWMPWAVGLAFLTITGTAGAQDIERLETEYETEIEYEGNPPESQQDADQRRVDEIMRQQQRELRDRLQQEGRMAPRPGAQAEVGVEAETVRAEGRMEAEYEAPEYEAETEPMQTAVFVSSREDEPDHLMTPMGTSLSIGGGVAGFTDTEARRFSGVGGSWDARLAVGTRTLLAGELAYIGTANDIDALGLDNEAILVSNGAEAAARLNFLQGPVQPYALAGIGWRHYSLENADFNTSDVLESDDVGHVPLGAGVSFRFEGLVLDARGVFRPSFDSDMMGPGDAELHTWNADVRAGWEF